MSTTRITLTSTVKRDGPSPQHIPLAQFRLLHYLRLPVEGRIEFLMQVSLHRTADQLPSLVWDHLTPYLHHSEPILERFEQLLSFALLRAAAIGGLDGHVLLAERLAQTTVPVNSTLFGSLSKEFQAPTLWSGYPLISNEEEYDRAIQLVHGEFLRTPLTVIVQDIVMILDLLVYTLTSRSYVVCVCLLLAKSRLLLLNSLLYVAVVYVPASAIGEHHPSPPPDITDQPDAPVYLKAMLRMCTTAARALHVDDSDVDHVILGQLARSFNLVARCVSTLSDLRQMAQLLPGAQTGVCSVGELLQCCHSATALRRLLTRWVATLTRHATILERDWLASCERSGTQTSPFDATELM